MKKIHVAKMLNKEMVSNFEADKKKTAQHFGLSVMHLNRVLSGNHSIPDIILKHLQLRKKEIEYEKIS